MAEVITYQRHEYRMQGGEIHRRPADRDGLSSWDAAWLVLNREDDYVPPLVREQLSQGRDNLRFD